MNESQPCGFGEVYFENNVIKYRGYFKNGKLNGYGKIYYNGNLRYEGFFYKDELIMIIKQYNNYENLKAMAIESSYNDIDNFIFSGELYYPNGALKYASGIEFIPNDDTFIFQGIGKYYYDNGQLCCAGKLINGQLIGKNKIFSSNGNLKAEDIFVFDSGQLAHEFIYDYKNEYLATLNGYGILYYNNGNIWGKEILKITSYMVKVKYVIIMEI